jgi:hypothetical protein
MGSEMVASLPPLRIWKSEAEGKPAGAGAIDTGEGDASLLLRAAAVDALEFRLGPGLEVSRSNFDRSNFLFLGSILPSNSGHLCGNSARLALTAAAAQPSAAPGILMIHDWRPWGVTGSLGRRVLPPSLGFLPASEKRHLSLRPPAPHRSVVAQLQWQRMQAARSTRRGLELLEAAGSATSC